jgi:hypothetical protein
MKVCERKNAEHMECLCKSGFFDPHVARDISPELHSGAIEVPWDSDAKYQGVYEFGGLQPGMSRWVVCAASPKR